MRIAAYVIILVVSLLLFQAPVCEADPIQVMPVSEIRPGMKGVVLTVLYGTEPESLAVEVLSIMPANSPGRHTVIVQGFGELAHTGIASGMSGSPVYVDGKLIGALAFAFNGALEAIGGVTPFEEMALALDEYFIPTHSPRSSNRRTKQDSNLLSFPQWRSRAVDRANQTTADIEAGLPLDDRNDDRPAMGMSPIRLPLQLENGSPALLSSLQKQFDLAGLQTVPAISADGSGIQTGSMDDPIKPGDALSVNLISGDMSAAVIGTVTWVEGDKVIAFGHPFLSNGTTDLPVGRAQIHAIIPNRNVSFKVGSPINEIGSLIADREPGVAARIGGKAQTIPLDLTITSDEPGNWQEKFHFDIAKDVVLTPSLMTAAVGSAMREQAFSIGLSTLKSQIEITLDDGQVIRREDLFRTMNPPQTIATEVLAGVNYLIASNFREFPVTALAVNLNLKPQLDAIEIERLHVDRGTYQRGDKIQVDINLRRHLGETLTKRVTLEIPQTAQGTEMMVMVGSASAFYLWDSERAPDKYRPRSFDGLVNLIEDYPSDEDLIIRLFGSARGLLMRGQEISSMPLSKWRVLSDGVSGGEMMPVGGIILDEVVIKTGEVVLGGNFTRVELKR